MVTRTDISKSCPDCLPISNEAPTSIYELAALVGGTMEPSSVPLENPWRLHMDVSLARRLGFQPVVRTVYQAAQENLM